MGDAHRLCHLAGAPASSPFRFGMEGFFNQSFNPIITGRESLLLPEVERPAAGGAVYCAVLAGDLHLEDDIGLLPGGGAGAGEKGDKPALEGSEAALDLALGLG